MNTTITAWPTHDLEQTTSSNQAHHDILLHIHNSLYTKHNTAQSDKKERHCSLADAINELRHYLSLHSFSGLVWLGAIWQLRAFVLASCLPGPALRPHRDGVAVAAMAGKQQSNSESLRMLVRMETTRHASKQTCKQGQEPNQARVEPARLSV